ncbi:helix-turn-helix family protein [Clostridium sporogenes]|uniref:Helix-turn-helix family protein n=1 Tax=Clostridium sporogenes TaxID=1509 RepID=A0A1L3NEC0_CLOSG|nr:helix-turn-helix transcriptional regulator [Clostridium sporogenes]APH14458.1 helix-turn-helix family protein [Clostridium sporogenes]
MHKNIEAEQRKIDKEVESLQQMKAALNKEIDNINSIIAENLKTLRTERNLNLGQLAKLSDISKVMLSQIEKGDTNPTINTLWKIAKGLKVLYISLLEQKNMILML